ncbi:hypothetical protein NUW54_g9567 [Trametes sanguinea]|nr:hypothetical protein NUW54_g9567 [Trametes sanguinea]
MLSNAPTLNEWSSTEGGELVVGQSGTNSFPSSPLTFSNANTPSPPRDPSAIPARQSASGSDRTSITNKFKLPNLQHDPVAAPRPGSSTNPKHKSIPGLKRTGPPGDNTLSLLNDARRQGDPIPPGRSYAWGSMEEHVFSHRAVDATLSLMANSFTNRRRHAAATNNVVATQQAQPDPHRCSHSSSSSPLNNTDNAPGTSTSASPNASSSDFPRSDLDDGALPLVTGLHIQMTSSSQSSEGVHTPAVIKEALPSANPLHPAIPGLAHGTISIKGVESERGDLTLTLVQQLVVPPSTVSRPDEDADLQEKTLESDEAETNSLMTVEDVLEADIWIKHWHEGVRGDDGYIYQLPPPILGYRPASRLHDLQWRGSQQHYLL